MEKGGKRSVKERNKGREDNKRLIGIKSGLCQGSNPWQDINLAEGEREKTKRKKSSSLRDNYHA